MPRKYWRSIKDPRVVRIRRKQLDLLFMLANTGLKTEKDTKELQTFKEDYAGFVLLGESDSVKTKREQVKKVSSGNVAKKDLALQLSGQDYGFFMAVQSHLVLRIHEIMDASIQVWEMDLWQMGGFLRIGVDPINSVFTEEFIPHSLRRGSPLQRHKRLIDLTVALVIRDLDLKPHRFRECQKCNKLFYQPTAREKNYCSLRCAGTARQARYRAQNQKKGGDTRG